MRDALPCRLDLTGCTSIRDQGVLALASLPSLHSILLNRSPLTWLFVAFVCYTVPSVWCLRNPLDICTRLW